MEQDFKKTVGQRLQLLRLQKNMTQEQMSEKLSLSTSAYCKIEYGETDLTLTRLKKIAEVLGLSVFDLFEKIHEADEELYRKENKTDHRSGCYALTEAIEELMKQVKASNKSIEVLSKRIELLESRQTRG